MWYDYVYLQKNIYIYAHIFTVCKGQLYLSTVVLNIHRARAAFTWQMQPKHSTNSWREARVKVKDIERWGMHCMPIVIIRISCVHTCVYNKCMYVYAHIRLRLFAIIVIIVYASYSCIQGPFFSKWNTVSPSDAFYHKFASWCKPFELTNKWRHATNVFSTSGNWYLFRFEHHFWCTQYALAIGMTWLVSST